MQDTPRKQHCYECLRRSLVCDFTRPSCTRCITSGTPCPGYDRPPARTLRWLAPGQVTSRKRKTKKLLAEDVEVEAAAVIPRFKMRTDACAVVQAVEYYNVCIYPDLTPIQALGKNPYMYLISPSILRAATSLPDFLMQVTVCMTLSHRMHRTRSKALARSFYEFRGKAIRGLNEMIGVEKQRAGDAVLAGILMLLLTDAQQGGLSDWRYHIAAVQRIISLRGGIRALVGQRSLEPLLLAFLFSAVIANTTSPASDLVMTELHLAELDCIFEHFSGSASPFHMRPPLLLAGVIQINHLRHQAGNRNRNKKLEDEVENARPMAADLSDSAYRILRHIEAFSPEQWAGIKPSSNEDWMVIGSISRAAAAIYCILSLQSLSVFPLSSSLREQCSKHSRYLQKYLGAALSSPRIRVLMLWPLVVLGVEAVHGGLEMRSFVAKQLEEMSWQVGTSSPLAAKTVLERFWASGATRWDSCFDRPYAFITQIAVDVGRIML